MIEKFKLAELLEKHKFMEKRKAAEYEAETLQIQQQVAKAKGPPKILEELNKEGKEKVSKTFLYAEDENIPLQQQKEYDYSELATKLTSQSSELYGLVVDNRPSNDLSDECRSPRILNNKYGDPRKILSANRKEIKEWPAVKEGDAAGFRRFFNFLVKCKSLLSENKMNALINNPNVICMILSKLATYLQDRRQVE